MSNALNINYEGGLVKNINARDLITYLLDIIRNLKPEDLSDVLTVAFPDRLERAGMQIFLKFLSDGRILTAIIENATAELNKILDPQLGEFFTKSPNFNQQLYAATQKTATPEMRDQWSKHLTSLPKGRFCK